MLKILQKLKFDNLKNVLVNTFRRTPLSMLISILAFVIIVVLIRVDDMSLVLEDNLNKAVFTLIVTFFFSVAIYLYSETKDIVRAKRGFYQLATFVFALFFYYFFEENLFRNPQAEIVVYLVLTSLGVISFVFIAAFVNKLKTKSLSQREFYIATYALVIKTLMSVIVGLVTMTLGFIALSATFVLFDITNIDEANWFGYWSAFSLSLFAPLFFLINLPSVQEGESRDLSDIRANKFYSFLINYVGIGAIAIYFLILYSYTIKVLMHFSEWPQGEVTWLVISFSFFGYLIYFASFAFASTFKPAQILRKILPTAIFLQTFMLFYAIGLRINQYDLTINRYLVVAFGLWLFGLSLYYIVSRKKNLAVSFYSLLIVIIFISIGPWSVYVMPEWRQENNLEINLKKANILQADNRIVPLEKYSDIEGELSGEIYGAIRYLCNYHGCETLEKYFALEIDEIKKDNKEEFEKNKQKQLEQAEQSKIRDENYIESIKTREYFEIRNWELISKLSDKIKVRAYRKDDHSDELPMNFSFRSNNKYLNDNIDIRGYDYLAQIFSDNFDRDRLFNGFENDTEKINASLVYSIVLDVDSKKLELYLGEEILETFQIDKTIIEPLLAKKNDSLDYEHFGYEQDILLTSADMIFNLSGFRYDLKLVLGNIRIRNPEWVAEGNDDNNKELNDEFRIKTSMIDFPYASGYVLIKKK